MHSASMSRMPRPRRQDRAALARVPALLMIATFLFGHAVGCATLLPDFRAGTPNASPPRLMVSERVIQVEPGAHVRIAGDDGGYAEGDYLGVADASDSAYAVRFAAHREALEAANIPALGESIRWAPRSKRGRAAIGTGRFRGFDYLGIRIEQDGGAVRRYPMTQVDSLWRQDGRGISGWQLAHLDADHQLPSYTLLVVRQSAIGPDGRFHVSRVETPWECARSVSAPAAPASASHAGEVVAVALVAGIVGAAIVIYVVADSMNDAADGCTHALGSMPAPGLSHADLRHVHRAQQDFDRVAGEFVVSGPALAVR